MKSTLKRIFPIGRKKKDQYVYNKNGYEESFEIPMKLLSRMSIRMSQHTRLPGIIWDIFYWFEFLNILLALPSEFLGVTFAMMAAESFQEVSKVFMMIPCMGSSLLSMFKSFKIVYQRSVYENLFNELRNMRPEGEVSPAEHKIIQRALKQLNFVVKGYYWCNSVLLISFLGPPFVVTLWRYMGYESPMSLHFIYWLPFDPLKPIVYEVMLLVQTWQALIVIWWNVSWDMLFCTFLCHLTVQLDLLALRIEKLCYTAADQQLIASYPLAILLKGTKMNKKNSLLNYQELREIVLRHISLIRLSKDMENLCSLTLLVNFLNGSIIICFCGFCSIVIEKWSDVAYKSFLATTLSQTWLLCWYGQKLIDSSLRVQKAAYDCAWYDAPQIIKASLLIILHRAQRSIHVTTYGFSVVSLASFSNIIKSSWTYFTLIMNFYKS